MLRHHNQHLTLLTLGLVVPLGFMACGGEDEPGPDGSGGGNNTGGSTAVGGSPGAGGSAASGGSSASGGQGPSSGGSASGGSGAGGAASGGAASGGAASGGNGTGGAQNSGGSGSGGAEGTGGGSSGGGIIPGTANYNCDPAEGSFEASSIGVEEYVTSGLSVPIGITHPPNDDRLFVFEQNGAIKIVEGGSVSGTFLDIGDRLVSPGNPQGNFNNESGLLGVAFHPDYAQNGLFYVHYTASSPLGRTTIAEYSVSGDDPNVADPGSERILLTQDQPDRNHNGGTIRFGEDGLLYIGLGDGGPLSGYDPNGHGQNPATLLGSLLRIDPVQSGEDDYTAPSGNLVDEMGSAAPEVFHYGLRNPFRFSFDACNGDLYIGDVGQGDKEELDIVKAGSGHHNFGWNIVEGSICTPSVSSPGCDTSGFTMPVFDYDNSFGAAIIGGSVYRGSEFPALRGTYFFTDNGDGRVWITQYDRDANSISPPQDITSTLGSIGAPAAIENGNDGELYIAAAGEGALLKVVLQ